MRIATTIILFSAAAALNNVNASGLSFMSTDFSDNTIELEAHALAGLAGLTHNYTEAISGIAFFDSSPGSSGGLGVRVDFPFRDFLSLSTGLDVLWNHTELSMTMLNDDYAQITTIYADNNFCYARFPIVMSWRFNLSSATRWTIDGGIYLAAGMGGKQNTTIFTTNENSLGQMVTTPFAYKTKYFKSDDALINSHKPFDYGLQLATGLLVKSHYSISTTLSYGLRNSAKQIGPDKVKIHNLAWYMGFGYKF